MSVSFRYRGEAFAVIRKRIIVIYFVVGVGLYIYSGLIPALQTNARTGILGGSIMLILIGIISIFSARWTINRQRKMFDSFELKIDEDKISRTQDKLRDLMIPKTEIREIVIKQNGTFIIKGKNSYNTIYVLPYVSDPQRLRSELNKVHTFKKGF